MAAAALAFSHRFEGSGAEQSTVSQLLDLEANDRAPHAQGQNQPVSKDLSRREDSYTIGILITHVSCNRPCSVALRLVCRANFDMRPFHIDVPISALLPVVLRQSMAVPLQVLKPCLGRAILIHLLVQMVGVYLYWFWLGVCSYTSPAAVLDVMKFPYCDTVTVIQRPFHVQIDVRRDCNEAAARL